MGTTNSYQDNNALLQSAKLGFDHLFSNDIVEAKKNFERSDDPFHLLGLGVCSFLEAALGMEVCRSSVLSEGKLTALLSDRTVGGGCEVPYLVRGGRAEET